MLTILVVEDDSNQSLLYEQELEDEGYRVLRATNGSDGIKLVREASPDCVVLDINMPVMDGMEALGRMLEAQPQLPIIINTAYTCYQDEFLSWAADAYVCKSSDLTELKTRIREALETRASHREESHNPDEAVTNAATNNTGDAVNTGDATPNFMPDRLRQPFVSSAVRH